MVRNEKRLTKKISQNYDPLPTENPENEIVPSETTIWIEET